ncbi:PRAI-domain-containing protein [Dentipellis sp. KUC8613]|nr:PRAI-domain-containing protein [Dentipellis sp. KUC8613]
MAEIKRASPSKGPIALDANAAQQALSYALAGASVISGSLLDMHLARQAIDSLPQRPAILRKDFVLDEYQIAEARLHGADTVLLTVAMLPFARLQVLYVYSLSLGMEPLVEVNNAREMEAALALGAKVISVNNRNLHDFQVDMGTTSRLADMVAGRDVTLCAFSGIQAHANVAHWLTPAPLLDGDAPPLVKICAIRTDDEALAAADAGADLPGLMFVSWSRRHVSLTQPRPHAEPVDTSGAAPWFASHARRMAGTPARPLLVGVFQNQPLPFVLECVEAAQLDLVQLHGREPAEWARLIPVPVIRVFHVDPETKRVEGLTRPGLNQFVLLDAAVAPGKLSGGSGKAVDWDLAREVVQAGEFGVGVDAGGSPMPIILAGGLTPENVAEAVERVRPWAVDVSGSVEAAEGGKDVEKFGYCGLCASRVHDFYFCEISKPPQRRELWAHA